MFGIMHTHDHGAWRHEHTFGTDVQTRGERRTWWVIGLTAVMMVAEIVGGLLFESMALLADGWHMGTHAAALAVAAFAYAFARKHANDRSYSFGTGKVSALGGFASAVGLAVVALFVLGESLQRLAVPRTIKFDEAIAVAVIGLAVNLACAYLLRDDHAHAHGEEHDHDHQHHHHHHDHNLRGAYLHVLADALTSVLAIGALTTGKYLGWGWLDPAIGIVGSIVIARWSVSLLRDTSRVLLDAELPERRRREIERAIETDSDDRVVDLHVWRVGPRHLAAIVSVVTHEARGPDHYKKLLAHHGDLAHVTVEVHACPGPHARD
jgi:cation diffusion facilitator family transporter